MYCCAECFGDRGLRSSIIPSLLNTVGHCSYCDSDQVRIVPPDQLADYLWLLINAYKADQSGRSIIYWFRADWGLFQHPHMDDPRAADLVASIVNDAEVVSQTFLPSVNGTVDRLVEWETFREELIGRNRFFPQANIDLDRLGELLSHLSIGGEEITRSWYRARIQTGDQPFAIGDMGAPPGKLASYGRANPAGIPYLYLASTRETAISEIRPHTGQIACVADFRTPEQLKLVDLRHPRRTVSPFLLVSAQEIAQMRDDLPFLERLGEELTRPVLPQAAAVDYTPTQYLCEFIKHCGYDGVAYRSSVGDGTNLALFNPSVAMPMSVNQYRIKRVTVEIDARDYEL
jgi:hypothetical protein